LRIKRLICPSVVVTVAAAVCAGPAGAASNSVTPSGAGPAGAASNSVTPSGAGPAGAASNSVTLSGAGSTLVAPLVAEWATEFQVFYGDQITFDGVGSQVGINEISSGTVDFAATDSPLTSTQVSSCTGCVQIPWTLTGIGIGYHVLSVGNTLRLSGKVVAEIYLGQLTNWNDPQIKALNPGASLPSLKITPVYANASGDTYDFTTYLSRVSSSWRSRIGAGNTVSFPTGISANGNAGLTALLESTNGAIAYVGASYLISHRLPAAAIQNAAGRYEYPNLTNIKSAASTVHSVPAGNAIQIVDPPRSAKAAYPISTFSYAIVSRTAGAARRSALKDWLTYCTGPGQSFGQNLDFAPIPSVVLKADKATIRSWSA
jgi:phosphate transport system substrate-binding protein